jgi:hypothetical protein
VPALLLGGLRVHRNRSKIGTIAVGATLLLGYSYLPKLMGKPAFASELAVPAARTLASAPYVSIGLAALGLACVHETRLVLARLPWRQPAPRRSFTLPPRLTRHQRSPMNRSLRLIRKRNEDKFADPSV